MLVNTIVIYFKRENPYVRKSHIKSAFNYFASYRFWIRADPWARSYVRDNSMSGSFCLSLWINAFKWDES